MIDAIFAEQRLADIYDALEPDRGDLDAYLAMVEEFAAHSVLDIGCGTGTLACRVVQGGVEVTGVDPAGASLAVARRKPFAERVRWIKGDATALPQLRVDLVTMTANVAQVFLTDEDWGATLRGTHAALKPGGILLFEVRDPAREGWLEWNREQSHRRLTIPGVGEVGDLDCAHRRESASGLLSTYLPFQGGWCCARLGIDASIPKPSGDRWFFAGGRLRGGGRSRRARPTRTRVGVRRETVRGSTRHDLTAAVEAQNVQDRRLMPDSLTFTNLDALLFAEAGASKGDLVAYLDAVRDRLIPDLRNRPLSVIRAVGRRPFMQKNVPKYTPSWVRTVTIWAEASQREVSYALCNDRRTLLWFANQRAVEFHPALVRAAHLDTPLFLVLDLDPPSPEGFAAAVRAAHLVRTALSEYGLSGAVKTSGAKGVHVFVPVTRAGHEDVAAAARAIAARVEQLDPALATTAFMKDQRGGKVFIDATRVGGATVAAAYSPRLRAGVPVSFPLEWDELDLVAPTDFTIHTASRLASERPSWTDLLPKPQRLPASLVDAGTAIPRGRVQAMHEGRRRARAARGASSPATGAAEGS